MVSRAARPLTKIGFRRDVKMFLSILVGFLSILVVLLLLLLQSNVALVRETIWARQNDLAEAAMTDIRRITAAPADVETQLTAVRTRYGFAAIELETGARRITSGQIGEHLDTIEKRAGGGVARFHSDNSFFESIRRRFWLSAAITLVATSLGIALLMLYVPHILRPVEAMLGDARALGERDRGTDEASYLIETFRGSIATLKKQEEELKVLHEREKTRADDLQTITSTLTRSLTSGFVAIGADGRVLEMNVAAREILGFTDDASVAGAAIEEVLGTNGFADQLRDAVAQRRPLSRQEIEIRAADQPKTIGLTTVPLVNDAGTFLGTLALFTDLTQVRRLESHVRDLQTLADLGVMSAGIAHEFRNSLSTILGLLKLAQRVNPSEEVAAKLTAAEAEAKELNEAVSSLLQFARPMHLQMADVDLRQMVESVIGRLRESHAEIRFEIDGDPAAIRGDQTLLARAVENIVRNAIDAVHERGGEGVIRVDVRGDREPGLVIRDNGAGMSEASQANLFLPFHSTKSHGFGLGLPLARKIILLHGGGIAIHSTPGAGTTVGIDFARQNDALITPPGAKGVTFLPSLP